MGWMSIVPVPVTFLLAILGILSREEIEGLLN